MQDTFALLIQRIQREDPALTSQQLEKEIAQCIGEKINELVKKIITDYTTLLQEVIQEALGLFCEITPALSLYVSVSEKPDQKISIDPFSSASLDKMFSTILEKNFSTLAPEEIRELIAETINNASRQYVDSIVLSHPLLTKIFQKFMIISHEQLAVLLRDPVRIIEYTGELPQDATVPFVRPGMYL